MDDELLLADARQPQPSFRCRLLLRGSCCCCTSLTAPATSLCTHSMQLVIRAWCRFSFTGLNAWLAWRSAYFTRLASMRNRVYLLTNWTTTLIFGRDMSRF